MSKLFGGGGSVELPPPPAPSLMPDIESPAILAAKRRAASALRGGRASTILSGSDEYSTDKLGTR